MRRVFASRPRRESSVAARKRASERDAADRGTPRPDTRRARAAARAPTFLIMLRPIERIFRFFIPFSGMRRSIWFVDNVRCLARARWRRGSGDARPRGGGGGQAEVSRPAPRGPREREMRRARAPCRRCVVSRAARASAQPHRRPASDSLAVDQAVQRVIELADRRDLAVKHDLRRLLGRRILLRLPILDRLCARGLQTSGARRRKREERGM